MKTLVLLKTGFVFAITGIMCLSYSCKNKLEDINAITITDTFPVETGINVEIISSDSAQIQAIIKAPLYKRYKGKNPYIEMPKGIKVVFYDSLMRVKTRLTSKYAIKYDKLNVMEVRNDVVVINEKGEQLNTEHLIWDQKKKRIYNDVFVKITTVDKIFYGDGLDADDSFLKWIIKRPRGYFYIKDDELNTSE
jgi:LPS export ABC transporter protein LptC